MCHSVENEPKRMSQNHKITVMKKVLFIFLLGMLCARVSVAQEEAIYNHYILNPFLINPGAAGSDESANRVFFNYRSQWAGFPGSPKSYAGSWNGPIGNRLGLGAIVFAENIAQLSRVRAQASYAYRYSDDKLNMGIGFSTEFHRVELRNEFLNDPFYEEGDELIAEKMNGVNAFDVTLGFFGTYDQRTFFGVSLPNLIRNRLDEISDPDGLNNSPIRYFTALVGHRFEVPGRKIELEPSLAARKLRGLPLIVDVNLKATLMDGKLLAGLNYTAGLESGWFGLLFGVRPEESIQLVYSFHSYSGEFQSYSTGSHEISIGFFLPRKEKK